ncbi:MAG: hypothetical protein ACJAW1_003313, partial [Glaciecola sp.]
YTFREFVTRLDYTSTAVISQTLISQTKINAYLQSAATKCFIHLNKLMHIKAKKNHAILRGF